MVGIFGNHTDVCGDDIGLKIFGKVKNALTFFHAFGVFIFVAEAAAQITAEGGNDKTVILDEIQKFTALCGRQIFGSHFASRCIDLNALCTEFCGSLYLLSLALVAQRVNDNTNRKNGHGNTSVIQRRIQRSDRATEKQTVPAVCIRIYSAEMFYNELI